MRHRQRTNAPADDALRDRPAIPAVQPRLRTVETADRPTLLVPARASSSSFVLDFRSRGCESAVSTSTTSSLRSFRCCRRRCCRVRQSRSIADMGAEPVDAQGLFAALARVPAQPRPNVVASLWAATPAERLTAPMCSVDAVIASLFGLGTGLILRDCDLADCDRPCRTVRDASRAKGLLARRQGQGPRAAPHGPDARRLPRPRREDPRLRRRPREGHRGLPHPERRRGLDAARDPAPRRLRPRPRRARQGAPARRQPPRPALLRLAARPEPPRNPGANATSTPATSSARTAIASSSPTSRPRESGELLPTTVAAPIGAPVSSGQGNLFE